jgi:hypothetical protein
MDAPPYMIGIGLFIILILTLLYEPPIREGLDIGKEMRKAFEKPIKDVKKSTEKEFKKAKKETTKGFNVVKKGTEKAAKEAGYEIKVGKFPFMASGKASAAGNTDGFVKVIFDAKYGEFLGAHMIGAGVTELIAEVVVARKLETTQHEILNAIHPHPTMSEAVKEAVAAAYGEAIDI